MKGLLLLPAVVVAFATSAAATDYRVEEVVPAGVSEVQCRSYANWWITAGTGPCTDFIAPQKIQVGQRFSERGVTHTIRIIVATRVEKDDALSGMRAGDWFCLAGEVAADVDSKSSAGRRTWLLIDQCV